MGCTAMPKGPGFAPLHHEMPFGQDSHIQSYTRRCTSVTTDDQIQSALPDIKAKKRFVKTKPESAQHQGIQTCSVHMSEWVGCYHMSRGAA